jgi:GTP pyrophosphokinase
MPKNLMRSNLLKGLSAANCEMLLEACDYAERHLSDINRRSGEDYAWHGLELAMTLKESIADVDILKVAVLHDLLVHPNGETLLREAPLNPEQKRLVGFMSVLRKLNIDTDAKDLDRLLNAMMENGQLITLRMAHRLNDIRHLERFSEGIIKKITRESLHMYTAIAGRLGMHAWRSEMEDICFRSTQPHIYATIDDKFKAYQKLDEACFGQTEVFLKEQLKKAGLTCRIEKRVKGYYSTYRKMVIKNRRFEDLTDRLAIRVIVPEVRDCYIALGIIHGCTHPIPGKLKDYIGIPKENGYSSIHTVIYPLRGITEQPMEIQIRSEDIHQMCEYGPASHGEYKTNMYSLISPHTRVDLIRNLESLRQETVTPKQFEEVLRKYFQEDHIPVFDQLNNLIHIKKPATAMDFVAEIHDRRLHMLKAVKINGRYCSLDTPLKNGDIVEPFFGRTVAIQTKWLSACHHPSAVKKIKIALKGVKVKK